VIDQLEPTFPAAKLEGNRGLVFCKAVNELTGRFRDFDLDADFSQFADPARREVKGLRKTLVQSCVIQLSAADFNVPVLQLLSSPADHFVGAIRKRSDLSIGRKGIAPKAF